MAQPDHRPASPARVAKAAPFRPPLAERLEARRFLSASMPDASFGAGGAAYLAVGADAVFNDVTVLPDGKVLAVGTVRFDPGPNERLDWVVARFTAAGRPDPAFGGGTGRVVTNFGGFDDAEAVLQVGGGKFVVVGSTRVNGVTRFAVARYNANGTPDSTFSGDGRLTTTFAAPFAVARAVALTPSGKLVAAGEATTFDPVLNADIAVARYNANGTPDTSFSGDGKATIDYGGGAEPGSQVANDLAVLPDGKLVVAGYMSQDGIGENTSLTVARLTAGGSLDPTFGGGDGWLRQDLGGEFEHIESIALQRDGRIVAAGLFAGPDAGNFRELLVTRYTAGGAVDASFGGGDGVVRTTFSSNTKGNVQEAHDVLVQPDGKILAVGFTEQAAAEPQGTQSRLAVARYRPNGSLDTTFAGDGKLTSGLMTVGNAAAFGYDGRLVVAGQFRGAEAAVARFGADAPATASVAGVVYDDRDKDGRRDAGEPGLAGRQVYVDANFDGVYSPGEKSVTSGAGGAYKLSGLAPGTYRVRQVVPAGWARTQPAGGGFYDVSVAAGQAVAGKLFGNKRV